MNPMPTLARIRIFPVKSLDAHELARATLLPGGAIENDRRFAIRRRDGELVVGKNSLGVFGLRSSFDPATCALTLIDPKTSQPHIFELQGDRRELDRWLSKYFDLEVSVIENPDGGFPDDTESPGPTVISTRTLAAVADWFPGVTLESARDRFRANLELTVDDPFWEDRLVAEGGRVVRFRIGKAVLLGTNPCARCPVPARDPRTGEAIPRFSRVFADQREVSLPEFAPCDRFDHFYRLAVNTRPARGAPCEIAVGDEVELLGVE
jgi:uncharacterized protein YcbX